MNIGHCPASVLQQKFVWTTCALWKHLKWSLVPFKFLVCKIGWTHALSCGMCGQNCVVCVRRRVLNGHHITKWQVTSPSLNIKTGVKISTISWFINGTWIHSQNFVQLLSFQIPGHSLIQSGLWLEVDMPDKTSFSMKSKVCSIKTPRLLFY